MKKLFALIGIIFFVYYSFNSYAFVKNATQIKANSIIYNKKLNAYYGTGNCVIYNKNYSIESDSVSFYKNTSIANLKGHIVIHDTNGDWIKGTEGTINLSTFKGFIDNAVMFIKKSGMYIKAHKIITYSRNKYYLKNGIITGCKCKQFINGNQNAHPKWSVWAKHTYIVKNNYIFSYPVIFKAKNIPILFFPALSRNLSNKRKTGFLSPSVGYSNKDGVKYEQPFFININPSQDITLKPFIYYFSGYGLGAKYRFYWTKYSKGEWNATLFKEKQPYGASKNKKLRIYIKAKQYVNLKQYGNFKYNINILNNKDNLRVLNKDSIQISSNRYTTSTASYSITSRVYSLNVNGYFYQDLIANNNKATLQKLPEIIFDITNKKLWNNLTFDFSETATNNFRITGNRGYSSLTTGFLSYPFKISYVNITPKIGIHQLYAYWKDAPSTHYFSKRSFIPEYSVTAKTSLYRIFQTSNSSGIVGIKHTVTPSISYEYIPQRNQSGFPNFIHTYTKTNLITFTIENILTSKEDYEGRVSYREIFYNKISQGYDFSKTNHFPFKPIYEETRISPFNYLSFTSKAHFSTQKGVFTDSDEEINLNTSKQGISIGYLMSRDVDEKINSESAKIKIYTYPLKSLYTYIYLQKSLSNNYYPQKRIGFMYNEDCWGAGLDLYENQVSEENTDGTYSRKKNVGFWITLIFKGLGEIKKQY